MKNYGYIGILLVFVIMATVAVAGCTSSTNTNATATPAASGMATGTATAVASAAAGGSTPFSSVFNMGSLKYFEYQLTMANGTSNMREDFGVTYNGAKANEVSITSNMSGGMTSIMQIYSDASGNTLGGHMKTMQNGQVLYESDIPASSVNSSMTVSSNPIASTGNVAMTTVGTESVTVPAGTYTATKYTYTMDSASEMVWAASGVPVPVKMESSAGGQTTTMELVGWA